MHVKNANKDASKLSDMASSMSDVEDIRNLLSGAKDCAPEATSAIRCGATDQVHLLKTSMRYYKWGTAVQEHAN